MKSFLRVWLLSLLIYFCLNAQAQIETMIVDIPTVSDASQRILVMKHPTPKATVILLAGGHGGLQIQPSGSFLWGGSNFLIRSRQLFFDQGFTVVILDAPSNRQSPPFLSGFRQTPEHVSNLKATISRAREQAKVPVWLVGTSRGTQSAAYVATQLSKSDGPDGIVLTSTILTDPKSRPVTAMQLSELRIPVLVAHHEQDGCSHCRFSDVPALMDKLVNSTRKQLLAFKGGLDRGDACEAFAYHGFNGLESDAVAQIAAWITKE
jgi:hypothetical protein